jgi:hypothetical protein
MRPRPLLEILAVLGVVGLVMELASAHVWPLIAAGIATTIWLLARTHKTQN